MADKNRRQLRIRPVWIIAMALICAAVFGVLIYVLAGNIHAKSKENNASVSLNDVKVDNIGQDVINDNANRVQATVEVQLSDCAVTVGTVFKAAAIVTPANTEQALVWSSNNTGIFEVGQDGIVTIKGVGTAVLTATVGNVSDSVIIEGINQVTDGSSNNLPIYNVAQNEVTGGGSTGGSSNSTGSGSSSTGNSGNTSGSNTSSGGSGSISGGNGSGDSGSTSGGNGTGGSSNGGSGSGNNGNTSGGNGSSSGSSNSNGSGNSSTGNSGNTSGSNTSSGGSGSTSGENGNSGSGSTSGGNGTGGSSNGESGGNNGSTSGGNSSSSGSSNSNGSGNSGSGNSGGSGSGSSSGTGSGGNSSGENTDGKGVDSTQIGDYLPDCGFDREMSNVYVYRDGDIYRGEIITQQNVTIIYIMQRNQEFDEQVKGVLARLLPEGYEQVWNNYVTASSDRTFTVEERMVRIVVAANGGHSQIVIYN